MWLLGVGRGCVVWSSKKSACPWIEILYQNGDGYVKSWENSVVLSKTRITEKTNNTDESRHADNAVTTKIFVRVGFTLSPRVRWTRSDDQRFTESISSDKKTTHCHHGNVERFVSFHQMLRFPFETVNLRRVTSQWPENRACGSPNKITQRHKRLFNPWSDSSPLKGPKIYTVRCFKSGQIVANALTPLSVIITEFTNYCSKLNHNLNMKHHTVATTCGKIR